MKANSNEINSKLYNHNEINCSDVKHIDTIKKLVKRIKKQAIKKDKSIINYTVSGFKNFNANEMTPIPQYQYQKWTSLIHNINDFKINGGVLLIAPDIWQLSSMFAKTIKNCELFIAEGSIDNLPICIEMLKQAKISCIVTYPEAAIELAYSLIKYNLTELINLLVLFEDVNDLATFYTKETIQSLLPNTHIIRELHLFPGYILAFQDISLLSQNNSFYLSNKYSWHIKNKTTEVTGLTKSALPLQNFPLSIICKKTKDEGDGSSKYDTYNIENYGSFT